MKRESSFIKTYENDIKPYRDKYYNNLIKENNSNNINPLVVGNFSCAIISCLLIIMGISYKSITLTIILTTLCYLFINIYLRKRNRNRYLSILNRHGYKTIEEYEKKLKQTLFIPSGEYSKQFNLIAHQYKLDEQTPTLEDLKGNIYYVWYKKNKDKVYLLKKTTFEKPNIIKIKTDDINYYRFDKENNRIVVNTKDQIYYFKTDNIKTIKKIFDDKKYNTHDKTGNENYISDYDLFLYKKKKSIEYTEENIIKRIKIQAVILLLVIVLLYLVCFIYKNTSFNEILLYVASIILLILLKEMEDRISFNYLDYKETKSNLITNLKNEESINDKFNELKFLLNIKPEYDIIFSDKGEKYQVWGENKYFHLFCNTNYSEVVYYSSQIKNVEYYKKDDNYILKIKNNELRLRKDAKNVLDKIIGKNNIKKTK